MSNISVAGNNELEEILNQIDRLAPNCDLDLKALNYSELLCLHFILETHQSYGVIKLNQDIFPFEFSQPIIESLIEKSYLFIHKIDTNKLNGFLRENHLNFDLVQKSYFELLIECSSRETIKLNQQKIGFSEFRDLVYLELNNYQAVKYEDVVALESFIKNYQKEKSLSTFRTLINRYNLNIKETPGLTFKLEALALSHSSVNLERLLNITCRSVSADLRRSRHSFKFLQKLFMNRLDYYSNIKNAGAQLINNGDFNRESPRSIIDDFIERNLLLNAGAINSLSGSELISLWMGKPRIHINLRQLIS
jgi:hypothetical protein